MPRLVTSAGSMVSDTRLFLQPAAADSKYRNDAPKSIDKIGAVYNGDYWPGRYQYADLDWAYNESVVHLPSGQP
jgi:hypothetical protein